MRIVNEFNLGSLKCTLMLHNARYTLKMEDEYGEVNYKMGQQDSIDVTLIPSLMETPEIKRSIIAAFRSMRSGRDQLLHLVSGEPDEIFDDII